MKLVNAIVQRALVVLVIDASLLLTAAYVNAILARKLLLSRWRVAGGVVEGRAEGKRTASLSAGDEEA
jgi:hypothetical protein